ncbi:phosphatidylglycerophosphatase A family protein [Rhizosphaericola mali]|uniref:Phosphatidylglycerophosphatase A n=1 Tax=Rhizosphaericola mali TaxID=2545455 RepID=A0A5P2FYK1_9BACT|nr:phosphatidylglycerophosphatase A [Rhizosphaericola mali]QES87458.1 phosphatidylglycerophosphatase A [Rhizosphaericola mali]
MNFFKITASFFGVGYIKGGGTIAAAIWSLFWYLSQHNTRSHPYMQIITTIVVIILGIWGGNKVEKDWGEDSHKVVIDEIAGISITLLFVPICWLYILIGLILFRFFDITKPLYIRKMEQFRGGYGVMADDILAGIYSSLVLQAIVASDLISAYCRK